MPLAVKLAAALHALGLDPSAVDFDHDPALGLRPRDPETGDTIPPANDWRHIVPRDRRAHHDKTFGTHVPLSGDVSKIAKVKRLSAEQEAFRARLLTKGSDAPARPSSWPKRPFAKRPHKR